MNYNSEFWFSPPSLSSGQNLGQILTGGSASRNLKYTIVPMYRQYSLVGTTVNKGAGQRAKFHGAILSKNDTD